MLHVLQLVHGGLLSSSKLQQLTYKILDIQYVVLDVVFVRILRLLRLLRMPDNEVEVAVGEQDKRFILYCMLIYFSLCLCLCLVLICIARTVYGK